MYKSYFKEARKKEEKQEEDLQLLVTTKLGKTKIFFNRDIVGGTKLSWLGMVRYPQFMPGKLYKQTEISLSSVKYEEKDDVVNLIKKFGKVEIIGHKVSISKW